MPDHQFIDLAPQDQENIQSHPLSSNSPSPVGRSAMPPNNPLGPERGGDGMEQTIKGEGAAAGPRSFAPPEVKLQVSSPKPPVQRTAQASEKPVMQLLAVNLQVSKSETASEIATRLTWKDYVIDNLVISGRPDLGFTSNMGDHLTPFSLREEAIKTKLIGKTIHRGMASMENMIGTVLGFGFNEAIVPKPDEDKKRTKHQEEAYNYRKERYDLLKGKLSGLQNELKGYQSTDTSGGTTSWVTNIDKTVSLIQWIAMDLLSIWELSNYSGINRNSKRKGFKVGGSRNESQRMDYLRQVEQQLKSGQEIDDPEEFDKALLNVVVDLFDHAALSNVLGNHEHEKHFHIKDEKQLIEKLALQHFATIKFAFPYIGKRIQLGKLKHEFEEEATWGKKEVEKYANYLNEKKERSQSKKKNRKKLKKVDKPVWEFNLPVKDLKELDLGDDSDSDVEMSDEQEQSHPQLESPGMVQIVIDKEHKISTIVFSERPRSPFSKVMGAHTTAWAVHEERVYQRLTGLTTNQALQETWNMVLEADTILANRINQLDEEFLDDNEEEYYENRQEQIRQYRERCIEPENTDKKENLTPRLQELQYLTQNYLNFLNAIWGTTLYQDSSNEGEQTAMDSLRGFDDNSDEKDTKPLDPKFIREKIIPHIKTLFDFNEDEDFMEGIEGLLWANHLDFMFQAFPGLKPHEREIREVIQKDEVLKFMDNRKRDPNETGKRSKKKKPKKKKKNPEVKEKPKVRNNKHGMNKILTEDKYSELDSKRKRKPKRARPKKDLKLNTEDNTITEYVDEGTNEFNDDIYNNTSKRTKIEGKDDSGKDKELFGGLTLKEHFDKKN